MWNYISNWIAEYSLVGINPGSCGKVCHKFKTNPGDLLPNGVLNLRGSWVLAIQKVLLHTYSLITYLAWIMAVSIFGHLEPCIVCMRTYMYIYVLLFFFRKCTIKSTKFQGHTVVFTMYGEINDCVLKQVSLVGSGSFYESTVTQ